MSTSKTYFEDIGAWPKENILVSYVMGFVLSVICTLLAYMLAMSPDLLLKFSGPVVIGIIAFLALIQCVVQFIFFFHLSGRGISRERFLIFIATMFIVLILFVGSVWIMLTLNQRMMPDAAQMNAYMQSQSGI